LIGQFDYIGPTLQSARFLSRADEVRRWHSSNWKWALYVPYLLVPPAIFASFIAIFARRWRNLSTPVVIVGVTSGLQLATFIYMQFFGSVAVLELHFFSSTLWSSVNILLAILVAEMS